MGKTYFCTRPTIACRLLTKGYKGKRVANPYNSDRPAWEFEVAEGLYKEVNDVKNKYGTDTKEQETRVAQ